VASPAAAIAAGCQPLSVRYKKPRHSRSAHNEKAPLANDQAGLKVCDERGRRKSRVDESPF
jgi:hypothetical protein